MKKLITLTVLSSIFYGFSIGQSVPRYLMLEHFTNTRCSNCPSRNAILFNTLDANPGLIHHISVHPNVPYSNCVFQVHNPTDNNARKALYGVGFTPQAFLWGKFSMVGTSLLPTQTLMDSIGQSGLIQVKVSETGSGNTRVANIDLTSYGELPSGDYRLFAAVVERSITYSAPNGETEHHNVFRKMLPFTDGETITPPAIGEKLSVSYSFQLDSEWNTSEVYVTAFVQEMNTQIVYNSGTKFDLKANLSADPAPSGNDGSATVAVSGGIPPYTISWNDSQNQTSNTASNLAPGIYTVTVTDDAGIAISDTVSVDGAVGIKEDLVYKSVQMYPNPGRDWITVDMGTLNYKDLELSVYDVTGKAISSIKRGQGTAPVFAFSVQDIPNGLYYVRFKVDETVVLKRLSVIK